MSSATRRVTAEGLSGLAPHLATLLVDAVAHGGSLGFHDPLDPAEAESYWRSLRPELETESRMVLVAERDGVVVGSGQLVLPSLPNARHRAELQKLCVLSTCRGQGIGRALMDALHAEALGNGRTLVLLNTRRGEPPETFYRALGYELVGVVPGYTAEADGARHDTVILYRELPPGPSGSRSGE